MEAVASDAAEPLPASMSAPSFSSEDLFSMRSSVTFSSVFCWASAVDLGKYFDQ